MSDNVSLKHYLLTSSENSGLRPIYLRITYARKKAELYTGYKCLVKDWNDDNQVTKNSATINKELLDQKARAIQFFIDLQKEGKNVSANLLKDLLTGKARVKTRLLDYLDACVKLRLKDPNNISYPSLKSWYHSYQKEQQQPIWHPQLR